MNLDPQLIAALREDLAAFGSLDELFSDTANAALRRDETSPARAELAGQDGPEATAARLFFFADSVPRADVDAAFPRCGAAGLVALGILLADGGELRPIIDLAPVEIEGRMLWFASDSAGGHLAPDHVVGVGHASLTLAGITDRAPRRRALDLGTGGGIQAAGLAGHCEHIIATDLSNRALEFAAFNAALAGQEWALRQGSMFEPVAGERFDLIVSNPPFVITPAAAIDAGLARYEYRDAGQSGDRLFLDLLSELANHLAPGGSAQMLGNWEHIGAAATPNTSATANDAGPDGGPSSLAPSSLLRSAIDRLGEAAVGLDLWVIERETLDPAEYVEMWLRDGGMPAGEARERAYAAWLADFSARGVTAVGFGYVLARPQSGPAPIRRFERVQGPAAMPIGDHLAACFDALQRDGDIADLYLRVAEDVTIERHYRPFAEEPTAIVARQGGGLGRTILLSTALAGFFSAADGDLTAGQIAHALEALLGEDGLAQRVLNEAAEAHEYGLLTVAGH